MEAEGIPHMKLSIAERKEAAKEMLLNGASTREAGEVLGVSHTTVERDGTNVPEEACSSEEDARESGTFVPEKPIILPAAEGPFGLIVADPPWRYDFSETDSRAVENHYPNHQRNLTTTCSHVATFRKAACNVRQHCVNVLTQ